MHAVPSGLSSTNRCCSSERVDLQVVKEENHGRNYSGQALLVHVPEERLRNRRGCRRPFVIPEGRAGPMLGAGLGDLRGVAIDGPCGALAGSATGPQGFGAWSRDGVIAHSPVG